MKNKTVCLLICSLLILSCAPIYKYGDNKYKETTNKFIFKDSSDNLFLGLLLHVVDHTTNKKSKKLYFINDIGLINKNLIAIIDTIIDVETFSKYKGTDIYFFDKNRVYSYGSDPARYPYFNEVNINVKDAVIVDSLSIKDKKKECYKGVFYSDLKN